MAVDLGDLVDPLKREVAAPGDFATVFPNTTDDDLIGSLSDGFWVARLDGLLAGYTESEGSVTPTSGTTDLSRELQQLVVFYAGYQIVKNVLRGIQTKFRAKAGPVEYETAQSATQLTDILKELKYRRDMLLVRLSELGQIPSFYVDAYLARSESIALGETSWAGSNRSITQGW